MKPDRLWDSHLPKYSCNRRTALFDVSEKIGFKKSLRLCLCIYLLCVCLSACLWSNITEHTCRSAIRTWHKTQVSQGVLQSDHQTQAWRTAYLAFQPRCFEWTNSSVATTAQPLAASPTDHPRLHRSLMLTSRQVQRYRLHSIHIANKHDLVSFLYLHRLVERWRDLKKH